MAVNKGVAPDSSINLKVHGQNNYFVQFSIKMHTPMKKLMKAYCEGATLDMTTLRFQFDGQSFSGEDTPFSLELEDGDVIEVFQHRDGVDGTWNKPNTSREEKTIDSNEETYCLCKKIFYGKMIACDNPCCPIEWFHFGCVNVTTKPKGKWFCPKCKRNKKKK